MPLVTKFYKILYKNKEVVYVGVTTRTVVERFKEHLKARHLDPNNYTVVEFNTLEHPEITNFNLYYKERWKVSKLEQKYIKEELDKGSCLLNISAGGEWGATILNRLREKDLLARFDSYNRYGEY